MFSLGVFVGHAVLEGKGQISDGANAEQSVTGIGGVFFKVDDPKVSRDWYREHFGIAGDGQGVNFFWRDNRNPDRIGFTVWAPFPHDSEYFGSEEQEFMINFRVSDLDALLERLLSQGIRQVREIEEYPYGRFAWIVDGDGNLVELWEPVYQSPGEFEQ